MVDSLHRNVSLLALVFLVLHILTSVLDSFAPIGLSDAFIPFTGSYRPFWLGLGAVSFDLIGAVIITSLLRQRMGYGTWRAVHWLTYASWPIALLHGFGTGSDVKATWLLVLSVGCAAAVVAAVPRACCLAGPRTSAPAAPRSAAPAPSRCSCCCGCRSGPLGSEWARRSGTPSALLPHAHSLERRRQEMMSAQETMMTEVQQPRERPAPETARGAAAPAQRHPRSGSAARLRNTLRCTVHCPAAHGAPAPATARARSELIDEIELSGLHRPRRRGFPTATKLRAVAGARGRAIVVANGAEGEPASLKDRTLLEALPHLVLDGGLIAAEAVGADELILCACEPRPPTSVEAMEQALAERGRELTGAACAEVSLGRGAGPLRRRPGDGACQLPRRRPGEAHVHATDALRTRP